MPTYLENITSDFEGAVLFAELTVNQALAAHLKQRGLAIPAPVRLKALIDTGAYYCAITPGLAQRLTLRPHTRVSVIGIGETEPSLRNAFYVGLNLFGKENFDVYATEFEINFGHGINALIGRDLLNRLKSFTYDGGGGRFSIEI